MAGPSSFSGVWSSSRPSSRRRCGTCRSSGGLSRTVRPPSVLSPFSRSALWRVPRQRLGLRRVASCRCARRCCPTSRPGTWSQAASLRTGLVAQLTQLVDSFERRQTEAVTEAVTAVQRRLTVQVSKQDEERQQLAAALTGLVSDVQQWGDAQQKQLNEQQSGLKLTADQWKQAGSAMLGQLAALDADVQSSLTELRCAGQSECGGHAWAARQVGRVAPLLLCRPRAASAAHRRAAGGLRSSPQQRRSAASGRRQQTDGAAGRDAGTAGNGGVRPCGLYDRGVCRTAGDCGSAIAAASTASTAQRAARPRSERSTTSTSSQRQPRTTRCWAQHRMSKKMKAKPASTATDEPDARMPQAATDTAADSTDGSHADDDSDAASHSRHPSASFSRRSHSRQPSVRRDSHLQHVVHVVHVVYLVHLRPTPSSLPSSLSSAQPANGAAQSSIPVLSMRSTARQQQQQQMQHCRPNATNSAIVSKAAARCPAPSAPSAAAATARRTRMCRRQLCPSPAPSRVWPCQSSSLRQLWPPSQP